jgi:dual-specificity kinase
MIRPAEKYTEPAKIESSIVGALNAADPEDKNHIVRLKFTFYHKKYLCMAFEPLACSIYYLVQNNNHEGFPIRLVQSFSRQIFESVRFIHSLGYAHTDLKPENILLCNGELRKAFHPRVS